ncbi:MAG: Hpt domain-containing protein [Labilithrix sp.]|nr:Hpt domain-containing protein [Labilithrix sp.]MCW5815863.1 Hpt domain-containing protein [Labilithrix sp.]
MKAGLHLQVLAVVALVAGALVLAFSVLHASRVATDDGHALERRAERYAAIAAREVGPAVARDDAGDARAVLEVIAADTELRWIAVQRADGSVLASRGAPAVSSARAARGPVVVEVAASGAAPRRPLLAAAFALAVAFTGVWLLGRLRPMLARRFAARSREIELLLANVAQGFVVVDAKGRMGAHRSAVMARWFGPIEEGAAIWSLFRREDPQRAAYFELAWEAIFDGFLPVEVALEQLPKRLRHGASTFELAVRPTGDGHALVVLTDVTEQIEQEDAEATRSDLVALCERALVDRAAVADFVLEASALVRAIEDARTLIDRRRAIHTLKGVAAQVGASSVAAACAVIEAGVLASDEAPRPADVARLALRWLALETRLRLLFANVPTATVHVERHDLDALVARIDAKASHAELAHRARLLRLEPMQLRVDRAKDAAVALARRLGKGVDVSGGAGALRCDSAAWTPFWSAFGHVVRNAVDHGIEATDARVRAGKPPRGRISVEVSRRDDHVVIEATDDGAGVDWPAVAKRAAERGLPHRTQRDLETAVFADGLSTMREAHEVSGHGVGLAAVRAVTEAMGGRVTIESRRGVGTTLRFVFPVATLGDAYRQAAPTALAA